MVARLTQGIDQPAEHSLADRYGYRRAGPEHSSAAPDTNSKELRR